MIQLNSGAAHMACNASPQGLTIPLQSQLFISQVMANLTDRIIVFA